MDLLASLLQITFIFLLFRAILTVIGGISLSKRMKASMKNSSTETESVYNKSDNAGASEVEERPSIYAIEMVKDNICGRYIAKDKAYIIRSDDEDNYFCSWECRQKYIEQV